MSYQTPPQPFPLLEPADEDVRPAPRTLSHTARTISRSLQTQDSSMPVQYASLPRRLTPHTRPRFTDSRDIASNDRRISPNYSDSASLREVTTTPQTAYDPGWNVLSTASGRDLADGWQHVEVNVEDSRNSRMQLVQGATGLYRGNGRHVPEDKTDEILFRCDGRGGLDESAQVLYSRVPPSITPPYPSTSSALPYSHIGAFADSPIIASTALASTVNARIVGALPFADTSVMSLAPSPYPELSWQHSIMSPMQDTHVLGGTDASHSRSYPESTRNRRTFWDVVGEPSQQDVRSAYGQHPHGRIFDGSSLTFSTPHAIKHAEGAKHSRHVEPSPMGEKPDATELVPPKGSGLSKWRRGARKTTRTSGVRSEVTQRQSYNGDDPRGIGYTGDTEPDRSDYRRSTQNRWCVQIMRWRKVGKVWRGSWIWTRFSRDFDWKSATFDHEAFACAIEASAGSHLPQKIVMHIAMYACDMTWTTHRERTTLSLVCQQWRQISLEVMPRLVTQRQSMNWDDPRGIGYTGDVEPGPRDNPWSTQNRWFVQMMRWRKVGKVWTGSWVWTCYYRDYDWNPATWTDAETLDHAIETSAGRLLPQELLIHIAVCACDTMTHSERLRMSMVCREWRRICFPEAISRLVLDAHKLADFKQHIRLSKNGPTHRVKALTLHCTLSWRTFNDVGRFLGPGLELLRWRGNCFSVGTELNFPPLHAATVRIRTSFVKLHRLSLEICSFSSTTDLLRLIASLPSLVALRLVHAQFKHVSQSITHRRPTSRPLRFLIEPLLPGEDWLYMLAQSWCAWPVSLGGDCPGFSGLSPIEAAMVATIGNCLNIDTGVVPFSSHTWSLVPSMDPSTGLCTAWLARISCRNKHDHSSIFSVLFHVSTTAHVVHVLIDGHSSWHKGHVARVVASLDEALHALPHLRQVILQSTDANTGLVRLMTEGLVHVRDKVLVMPKNEYEQLAERLRNGDIPDPCPILPPLWVEKPEVYDEDADKW